MGALTRGDLVTVALHGDCGKPRPAVVIQSDLFSARPSVTVLPVTSDLRAAPIFRIAVEPDASNGLKKSPQAMVDKAITVPRGRISEPFGRLYDATLLKISRSLAVFLGIA
jgi:mRNA interferase MazF